MTSKSPAALETYARKRDFARTPEPSGAATAARTPEKARFVVQMHRASRLHYDFRLEADGVLKSWAIPKGPSFDTREKRLAMMVEDHPLDYRDFEGIIPEGNYGAGEVIVWDRGTYQLLEGSSTTEAIAKGSLKFEVFGEKLHGSFALVHIGARQRSAASPKGRGGEDNAWLLIKERDEAVDPGWRIEDHAQSVSSGKTLADIARDPRAPHWESKEKVAPPARTRARTQRRAALAPIPKISSPMLATAVDAPFDDPQWVFELKWDGYRAIAQIERDGTVAIVSRNGNDFTLKFPELGALAEAFEERPVIVDGEICVLDAAGRPSFSALQERLDRFGRSGPKTPVTYVVFDLLYGNGRDLRNEPLEARKAALEGILTGRGPVMLGKHVGGSGTKLFALARERGLEGIVAKKRTSTYQERRSRDWLKMKVLARQEFVIGGWTDARGSRKHFGALLVGVYDGDDFLYAGSVGTGFDEKKLSAIAAKLRPLERKTSAFKTKPKTDSPAHWVTPSLGAEVTFTEWTRDGMLRHPVFVALRSDKDPREVVRERPEPASGTASPRGAGEPGGSPRGAGEPG